MPLAIDRRDRSSLNEDRLNRGIEVAGISVKAISSNVRRSDLPWQTFELNPGIGYEGNLVVVEVTSDSGFRTAIENQDGVEKKLYRGDKFVRFHPTGETCLHLFLSYR